jgi:hypothetical protein
MRKLLLAAVVAATLLPFASSPAPLASTTHLKITNRLAPVGAASIDPASFPAAKPAGLAPNGHRPIPPSIDGSGGCPNSSATDVRANQECTNQSAAGFMGRSQSQNETAAAVNPLYPANVLLGQNDYRRGDGSCGVDWSRDGGKHWGSQLLPVGFTTGILNVGGARHYWTSSGDPSVGFDSSGEAYYMCGAFDRGFPTDERGPDAPFGASALILFRSADGGASWSFPGSIVTSTGGGEDPNATVGLLDKQYMAVDSNAASPWADRIYVVWANYNADFSASPIFISYSADHGNTWSTPAEISGVNTSLCQITFNDIDPQTGRCDESQFADPFIAPNGDLYVAMVNFNNCNGALTTIGFPCGPDPNDNHNQILIVKSTDGGASFSSPVLVSRYYDLPDCFTYTNHDFGRACVPTSPASGRSIFRATNYPSGTALSSTNITVDFGSYINPHSNPGKANCSPAGMDFDTFLNLYSGVGTVNGCNNDILESTSSDGGASFTGGTFNPAQLPAVNGEGSTLSDQWWQWTASSPSGATVVSYYDRQYGDDESTGSMDMTMAVESGGSNVHSRLTDQSLPPSNEFPDSNGFSDFMGDYTGLAVGSDGMAHPVWSDTRNPIYTYDTSGDPRTPLFAGFGSDVYTTARAT